MGRRRHRPAGAGHPGRRGDARWTGWPATSGRTAASRRTTCSSWRRRCSRPRPSGPIPRKQPTRGALMPSVLTEVGSITHAGGAGPARLRRPASARRPRASSRPGTATSRDRPLAAAYQLARAGADAGHRAGADSWRRAAVLGCRRLAGEACWIRLTNTGTQPWPAGLHAGRAAGRRRDQPYLRVPPECLEPLLAEALPALAPGRGRRRARDRARGLARGARRGLDHAGRRRSGR